MAFQQRPGAEPPAAGEPLPGAGSAYRLRFGGLLAPPPQLSGGETAGLRGVRGAPRVPGLRGGRGLRGGGGSAGCGGSAGRCRVRGREGGGRTEEAAGC